MFQKQDGDLVESDGAAPEERAYEDNWYRSLKALSEQRQDEDDGDQGPDVEDPVAGPVDPAPGDRAPTWAEDPEHAETGHVETEHVETEHAETGHVETPEAPAADAPSPTDRERLVSEEFETRAGQLLERLRSIQHLGGR